MKHEMKRASVVKMLLVILVIGSVGLSSGCGYALAGRGSSLPPTVRSIGIPLFVNRTPIFDLEQILTQRVRLEFIGRGKYQVVTEPAGAS